MVVLVNVGVGGDGDGVMECNLDAVVRSLCNCSSRSLSLMGWKEAGQCFLKTFENETESIRDDS